jgi:medium-chain acyl-[acyl-carrier-protein] hydrolase
MRRLRQLKGTREEVLENTELMELMLPALRADFELDETYQRRASYLPLDCPVTAFGGMEDDEVPQEDLEAWREVTLNCFRLKMFPGDHFFIHSQSESLLASITEALLE